MNDTRENIDILNDLLVEMELVGPTDGSFNISQAIKKASESLTRQVTKGIIS